MFKNVGREGGVYVRIKNSILQRKTHTREREQKAKM